jgi:hypothetical protein
MGDAVVKANVTDCPELPAMRLAQGMFIETAVTKPMLTMIPGGTYIPGKNVTGPMTVV